MGVYYAAADLEAANHSAVIVFDDSREGLPAKYYAVKEFCSGSHCAYLFALSR